jgi:hypothetical protein
MKYLALILLSLLGPLVLGKDDPLKCKSCNGIMCCFLEAKGQVNLTLSPSGDTHSINFHNETYITNLNPKDHYYSYTMTDANGNKKESDMKIIPIESYAGLECIISHDHIKFSINPDGKEVELRFVYYNNTEISFTLNVTHSEHIIPYPSDIKFFWDFNNINSRRNLQSGFNGLKVGKTYRGKSLRYNT